MADLTKLVMHSGYPGFHNNNEYTGSFTIPGGTITDSGLVIRTATITLDEVPDILDVLLNGPNSGPVGSIPRPADAWFKPGMSQVVQGGTQSGFPDQLQYGFSYTIQGRQITITAIAIKAYLGSFVASSSVNVSYKIIDYSAL